jgi:hypothetical protein
MKTERRRAAVRITKHQFTIMIHQIEKREGYMM